MAHPELTKAIAEVGLQQIATNLGITYQAIRKWEAQGRLPRTEWTGETDYATRIAAMCPGTVTTERLLMRHDDSAKAAA
jgi:hypothetical protein